jgi:hypothetical protein
MDSQPRGARGWRLIAWSGSETVTERGSYIFSACFKTYSSYADITMRVTSLTPPRANGDGIVDHPFNLTRSQFCDELTGH